MTQAQPDRGTLFWYSDGSFQQTPALATLLYAEQVSTNGGRTLFADMIAAFGALGRLSGLGFRPFAFCTTCMSRG